MLGLKIKLCKTNLLQGCWKLGLSVNCNLHAEKKYIQEQMAKRLGKTGAAEPGADRDPLSDAFNELYHIPKELQVTSRRCLHAHYSSFLHSTNGLCQ